MIGLGGYAVYVYAALAVGFAIFAYFCRGWHRELNLITMGIFAVSAVNAYWADRFREIVAHPPEKFIVWDNMPRIDLERGEDNLPDWKHPRIA